MKLTLRFLVILGLILAATVPVMSQAKINPDYLNASRADTLIIDQPYKLDTFDNWNPYVPGNAFGWGMAEIGMDDLMYLNYGDGKFVMWMADNVTANAANTVWTVHLRKGITWSDGVPFTADDIIYTIQMQVKNDKLTNHFYWLEWLDNVAKIDDLTVRYTLKKPNPRFNNERISGGVGVFPDIFIPKHIWEKVDDPTTFKNYDPAKGLPLGTGAYILAKTTTNQTIMVLNDNWWGAKTGFQKLPLPKKVVYNYVGTEEVRTRTAIDNGFDSMQ
ncbi:MAG TPA: ABC transporter substrate-binding protein, partial [Spirochaetia bacterium]|nr:ABC transporter substrate-binding protein [Spirochaetia bacterium]